MSEQALKRILVGVGVLVAVYAAVALLRGSPGSGGDGGGALAGALDGVEREGIREVLFVRPGDTVRLASTEEGWRVNGRPADSSRVGAFWSDLDSSDLEGPVARNPANHARLGVAADSAARVVFREEGGETVVLVGTSGRSYPSVHVRLAGQDPVYLYRGDLRTAARRSAADWRDRSVARVDTAAVATVEGRRGEARWTLTRAGDGWTVDGEVANAEAVRRLLGALQRLDATGFAADTVRLDAPDRRLVALEESGDTLASLAVGETEGSSVLLTAAGDSTVYEYSGYRADRLIPEASALREAEGGGG